MKTPFGFEIVEIKTSTNVIAYLIDEDIVELAITSKQRQKFYDDHYEDYIYCKRVDFVEFSDMLVNQMTEDEAVEVMNKITEALSKNEFEDVETGSIFAMRSKKIQKIKLPRPITFIVKIFKFLGDEDDREALGYHKHDLSLERDDPPDPDEDMREAKRRARIYFGK
jgi:hypothetical protein